MSEHICVECGLSAVMLEQRLSGEWVHPHPIFCADDLKRELATTRASEQRLQGEVERLRGVVQTVIDAGIALDRAWIHEWNHRGDNDYTDYFAAKVAASRVFWLLVGEHDKTLKAPQAQAGTGGGEDQQHGLPACAVRAIE